MGHQGYGQQQTAPQHGGQPASSPGRRPPPYPPCRRSSRSAATWRSPPALGRRWAPHRLGRCTEMSVQRKVQFFLAQTPSDGDGVRPPYDPSEALARIRQLPWRRRYDEHGERILRLWPRPRNASGMLGALRRTALPPVDRGETIGDLGLGPEEGIIEQMYFTVFDRRYVGIVRNQYG